VIASHRECLVGAGVYLIADAATLSGDALLAAVSSAVDAGVRLVQYRDKALMSQDQVDLATALCRVVHASGGLFLINDRVDLALACGADGVHLGQGDLPIETARSLLPAGTVVGISTHNLDEATAAQAAGADYIGFGNVFGTTSKADALPPCGTAPLADVCAKVSMPVYAIGGVGLSNLTEVRGMGADGGALIGAVLRAENPGHAAQALLARWAEAG
jgi:thiamine-phosphate pyrophosphorylase